MKSLFHNVCVVLHGIEEYHDAVTKQLEYRVGDLMLMLAKAFGMKNKDCEALREIGFLHDIGKIGISAAILEKPTSLTIFERKIIELHPSIGYDFIKQVKHPYAKIAEKVILTHHENYDGTGYPNGLSGDEIPLEGAICAICDVYDALRKSRPYRGDVSHEAVLAMTYDRSPEGLYHKFHPGLLDVFKDIAEDVKILYD